MLLPTRSFEEGRIGNLVSDLRPLSGSKDGNTVNQILKNSLYPQNTHDASNPYWSKFNTYNSKLSASNDDIGDVEEDLDEWIADNITLLQDEQDSTFTTSV